MLNMSYHPIEWDAEASPFSVRPFTQPSGITVPVTYDPDNLFSLFFTPALVQSIVMETNQYAAQCLAGTTHTWATEEGEIRAYFGFCILMGLVREPEIRDYWATDDVFHYAPIASRISRQRFEEISRYLHFVDNTTLLARGTQGYHRLQRIKPVIDYLRERFSRVYRSGANLAVDEAMIPFKGELYMSNILKNKIQSVYVHALSVITHAYMNTHAHSHAHAHAHVHAHAHTHTIHTSTTQAWTNTYTHMDTHTCTHTHTTHTCINIHKQYYERYQIYLHRSICDETISPTEASETRLQSLGGGGQCQRVLP